MFISYGKPGQAKARFGKPLPPGLTVLELTANPLIPQAVIENIPLVQKLDSELRLGQLDLNPGSSASPKKYGPCERCGMTFDVSTRYANHMNVHYNKEDTKEQNIARRLAKKYKPRPKTSRSNKK